MICLNDLSAAEVLSRGCGTGVELAWRSTCSPSSQRGTFFADPLELRGHNFGHLVMEGSAVVADGAGDGGEVACVGISVSLRNLGVLLGS